MNHYITADHHFGHFNIIKYTHRPYKSLNEMNYDMIRRWNERVKKDDVVIYNGDFCFKLANELRGEGINLPSQYWEKQLNGKIIFIKGNHDRNNTTKAIIQNMELFFDGRNIFITHRPKDFNANIQYNLIAHVHNNWKIKKIWTGKWWCYLYNVGVDVHRFYPITLKEAVDDITKSIRTIDIDTTTIKELTFRKEVKE